MEERRAGVSDGKRIHRCPKQVFDKVISVFGVI